MSWPSFRGPRAVYLHAAAAPLVFFLVFPFVAILTGRNRLVLRELSPIIVLAAAALYGVVFAFHHRLFA